TFVRCGPPAMLVESLQCGRVRPHDARGSATADNPAGPSEMPTTNESGTAGDQRPGETILAAVDGAFQPRPPTYRRPAPEPGPPATEPVALRGRAAGSRPPSLFGLTPVERRERLS